MKTQSKTLPFLFLGLAAIGAAPATWAQAPDIAHEPVGCLVAGKYPKLQACFSPASQVAKARVYFRREDRPIWYHVEMAAEAQCFVGILPRPTQELVGKTVPYYVEVASQRLDVGRTQEHAPQVVRTELDCRMQAVAPHVAKASVKVFPKLPQGFAAGGPATGLVAGGIAAAGIGAGVLVGRGDKAKDATAPVAGPAPAAPSPVPTPMPGPTPSPNPTPSPGANGPPTAVFAVSPDPPAGTSPVAVRFNLCRSSDPEGDPLVFRFDFGDGERARGACREDHTYRVPADKDVVYRAQACVGDGRTQNEQCRTYEVLVKAAQTPPPTPAPTPIPTPTPTFPLTVGVGGSGAGNVTSSSGGINCPGACTANYRSGSTVTLTATPAGGATIAWSLPGCGAGQTCTVTMTGPQTVTITFDLPVTGHRITVLLTGTGNVVSDQQPGIVCPDACSYPNFSDGSTVVLTADRPTDWGGPCTGRSTTCTLVMNQSYVVNADFPPAMPTSRPRASALSWISDLRVARGKGQVVVNGRAFEVGDGQQRAALEALADEVRFEATLTQAGGAGTWRFELPDARVEPGTLRVLEGKLEAMSLNALAFRLAGKPGERVVFTFRLTSSGTR